MTTIPRERRPSMASPLPNETPIDRYVVTDEEFESLQNFDWSCVSTEILTDLEFITKLPTDPVLDYEALGPLLPPRAEEAPRKTLFIDLDETLVHTSLGSGGINNGAGDTRHDLSFISDADGSVQARVYFRPWTHDFLKIMSNYYELVLYTASVKLYADIIVDELDPETFITHRLYREHCTQYGESEIYFKDLNGTGRPLSDSVVMDNRLISFGLNVANGIFVSSFTGQPNDTELLHLLPILVALSKQDDVRVALSETYKLPIIVQRYRQDIHADVARSLTNIGSPRAHRVDDSTSLHAHAISTLGALGGSGMTPITTPDTSAPDELESELENLDRKICDQPMEQQLEDDVAAKPPSQGYNPLDGGCNGRETSPADSLATTSTRQASSSTRHMHALSRISYSREEMGFSSGGPSYGVLTCPAPLNICLPSSPQRQGSLRRLVLPPSSPERRRRQSNPFKQTSARVAMTVHSSKKAPTAPKRLY